MSKKILFKKELKINNEDDKLEINDGSNRVILHHKLSNHTKFNKNFQTDLNEIYDIPKISRKPDPIFFQQQTNVILKERISKNFKTELSETGSVNMSSLSFGEMREKINKKKEKKPGETETNPKEKSNSQRKTITDYVTFFLSSNFSVSNKIWKFMKKLVLPHFLGIIISTIILVIQENYKSICFIKTCKCADLFIIKIYTTVKECLLYWNLIIIMGYITIFHVEFLKQFNIFKFFYIFSAYLSIFYFYLSVDCSDEEPNFSYMFIMGFFSISFFFLIYLMKIKWNFRLFIKNTSFRVAIITLIFLNYLMNYHGYKYLKFLIEIIIPSEAVNVYQISVAFCIFIFRSLFKYAFYKHAQNEEISQDFKLNSIGYFVRICICLISATEISNILESNLSFWGIWVILINHVVFLIIFYTRYNFPLIILNKLIKFIFKKDEFFKESESEKLVDKLFSGYMIDFQFILIPRLMFLYFYRKWLTIHIPVFYKNCELEISDKFIMNEEMVLIILTMNFLITIFIALWMSKNNKDFFIYIPEKIQLWKRAYIILLIHNYFEFVLQELRQINF